jgi:hypothetical protein
VVDVGAGTGVLALMACAAGASSVYAIERGPIAELARKIACVNGYGERIHFVRSESSRAVIPAPADVVVGDLIGPFAFDAGVFDVLADAYARYLKPHGRTIPSDISLYVAPAECAELRGFVELWREKPGGFDMSPAYEYARKAAYHVLLPGGALLSDPIMVGHYCLPLESPPKMRVQSTVRASRTGQIDALAGWFDATLAPGVHITNAPGAASRLARRDLLLPVSEPIPVTAGDEIAVRLTVLASDHVYRWTVERRDAAGVVRSFSGSTFEGLLVSREDLAHRHSDAHPAVTADGRALRLVLDLSDGQHSVHEIENAVAAIDPQLFADRARAAAFVADALTRYAR